MAAGSRKWAAVKKRETHRDFLLLLLFCLELDKGEEGEIGEGRGEVAKREE